MRLFSIFLLIIFALKSLAGAENDPNPPQEPQIVLQEMALEMQAAKKQYIQKLNGLNLQLKSISIELQNSSLTTDQKLSLLLQKEHLIEEKTEAIGTLKDDLSKIRYIKGVSVIKSLYEKVLALDHHFASVYTFSEINKISNPNHYPEFDKLKDHLKSKKSKSFSFNLSGILGENVYTSVMQTFLNLFTSDISGSNKEEELSKVECILDFTLRMHNDLNTIYFETQFLRASNDDIKTDIEHLFQDYTKPIHYLTDLKTCRLNDDWGEVNSKLNTYLQEIETAEGNEKYKKQVNLEFSVDRLLQFINKYNTFIDQGEKFYEKFAIILNSYENEQQCESKIPIEYEKLKQDVNTSIEKFKIAYKPVEINGSKMKEILYGLNEFD